MRHQHIRAGRRHRCGFIGVKDIGTGEQIQLPRLADEINLKAVAHPGLFQVGAEEAIDQPDGREVLDAVKAHCLDLAEKGGHQAEGIGATNSRQYWCILHHW